MTTSDMEKSLRESYRECRRVTSRSGSNFVAAFSFLPRKKRRAVEVLYAFMRLTDDLADEDFDEKRRGGVGESSGVIPPLTTTKRRNLLEEWRTEFLRQLDSAGGGSLEDHSSVEDLSDDSFSNVNKVPPVANLCSVSARSVSPTTLPARAAMIFPALTDVMRRFSIDPKFLLDVIDGVESDLIGPVRLETEEDALRYCDRVAGAVGGAVLAIFGTTADSIKRGTAKAANSTASGMVSKTAFKTTEDSPLHRRTLACGRAFQWTNFLRDLREDILVRGRVYFPMSDFHDANLTPTELLSLLKMKTVDRRAILRFRLADPYDPLTRFWRRQIERTESFYAKSDPLTDAVSPDCRKVFRLMLGRYRRIFQKIVRDPRRVFENRVRLTLWEKMILILFS